MTATEIIKVIREGILYDNATPYLWSDDLLEIYLNQAEREACRRANLIIDDSTASDSEAVPLPLCTVNVVAGTSVYTLSKKIIRIKNCTPSWNSIDIEQKTEGWLDEFHPDWRIATGTPVYFLQDKSKITLVPKPVANETKSVAGITRVGTVATVNLPNHEYDDGASVAMADADQVEYNGNVVITKIDDNYFSYTVSDSPNTPATGTITATLLDTLTLEVSRLPLVNVTIAEDDSPEIPEDYHFELADWVAHLALKSHDEDAENLPKSREHAAEFTRNFGPPLSAITESNRRRRPRNKGLRPKEFGFS